MGSFGVGGSQTTTKQLANWDERQQDLWQGLSNYIQQGAANQKKYEGEMYVPETGLETGYMDWARNNQGAREGAVNQVISGRLSADQERLYTDYDAQNAEFNAALADPTRRDFNTNMAPGIREEFAGNFYGSQRPREVTKSRENMEADIVAKRAGMAMQNRQQYATAQNEALNRQAVYGPQAEAALGQAGDYERKVKSEVVMSKFNAWMQEQDFNNPWIQTIMSALGLSPYSYSQETKSWNVGGAGSYGGGK